MYWLSAQDNGVNKCLNLCWSSGSTIIHPCSIMSWHAFSISSSFFEVCSNVLRLLASWVNE